MPNNLPDCDKIWQYVLIMMDDIRGTLNGLEKIGWYHQAKNDQDQMNELAQYTEEVAEGLRSRAEKLTGWEA